MKYVMKLMEAARHRRINKYFTAPPGIYVHLGNDIMRHKRTGRTYKFGRRQIEKLFKVLGEKEYSNEE